MYAHTTTPPPPENQAAPKIILLVEDETLIALSTKVILQKHGFTVLMAANGIKAVDIALRTPELDLILMDINLGSGMDGPDAAQQILAQRDLPIVFLSCHTEPDVVATTERITSYGYVVKNSGETVLIASIKMAFKLFDAHQRLKQQEEVLRKTKQELEMIFDAVPALIWQKDRAGTYLQVNKAYCDTVGFSEENILGKTDHDLFPQEIADAYVRDDQSVLQSGQSEFGIEEHHQKPSGGRGWSRTDKLVYHDLNGTIAGTIGFALDITARKRAEEALRESEQNFSALAENASDGILIATATGSHSYANQCAAEITGYSVAELREINMRQLAHPDELPGLVEQLRKRFAGEDVSRQYETRIITKAGAPVPIELTAAYTIWQGQPADIVILRDITDRKRVEEALREREALLNATGQIAKVGGWELDAQMLAVRWTEETYRIHEVSLDYKPSLQEAINFFHHEDRGKLADAIQCALNNGEPYDLEIRFITAKGKPLWTRTICQPYIVAGKVLTLKGIFHDITDRKRAEEALRLKNIVFDASVAANSIANVQGIITQANHAFLKVWDYARKDEVIGKPIADFLQHRQEVVTILTALDATGVWEGEYTGKRQDGSTFAAYGQATELRDAEDHMIGYQSSVLDITDRKRAEEALRESEQQLRELNAQKDKFFSILAHDLKNPLVGFLSFAELLENNFERWTPAERNTVIQHFRASAETLFALLENLLTWARLQQGQVKCFSDQFPFDLLVARAVDLLTPNAVQKQITLTNAVPPLEINANIAMTDAVVRNLLGNALKFTPPGGTVTITTTPMADNLCVTVADTGIGIPPDKLAQLFRIDGKTQRAGTNGEKGTGLGLILCKEFVEKQGGQIWAESEEGQGTRMMFTLPTQPGNNRGEH